MANDDLGRTPLHWAAMHSQSPAVVWALKEAGADLEARACPARCISLHLAADFCKSAEVVKALLDAGADPQAISGANRTAWEMMWKNDVLKGTDVALILKEAHQQVKGNTEN